MYDDVCAGRNQRVCRCIGSIKFYLDLFGWYLIISLCHIWSYWGILGQLLLSQPVFILFFSRFFDALWAPLITCRNYGPIHDARWECQDSSQKRHGWTGWLLWNDVASWILDVDVQTCSITLKCVSCSLLILSYLPLYLFIWLYKMLHPADLVQPSSFFYWHGHFINRLSISVHYASQSARIIQNQICGYLGLWNVFPQALYTHSNLTGAICIL